MSRKRWARTGLSVVSIASIVALFHLLGATTAFAQTCYSSGWIPQTLPNQPRIINLAYTADHIVVDRVGWADATMANQPKDNTFKRMHAGDFVFVTKHLMVWIDMDDPTVSGTVVTDQGAGTVRGLWTLNGQTGDALNNHYGNWTNMLWPRLGTGGAGMSIMASVPPEDNPGADFPAYNFTSGTAPAEGRGWCYVNGPYQTFPDPAGAYELRTWGYLGRAEAGAGRPALDPIMAGSSGKIQWHVRYRFHPEWAHFEHQTNLVAVGADVRLTRLGLTVDTANLSPYETRWAQSRADRVRALENRLEENRGWYYTVSGSGLLTSDPRPATTYNHATTTTPVFGPRDLWYPSGTRNKTTDAAIFGYDTRDGTTSQNYWSMREVDGSNESRSWYLWSSAGGAQPRMHMGWPRARQTVNYDDRWCRSAVIYDTVQGALSFELDWWHFFCGDEIHRTTAGNPNLPLSEYWSTARVNQCVWCNLPINFSTRF